MIIRDETLEKAIGVRDEIVSHPEYSASLRQRLEKMLYLEANSLKPIISLILWTVLEQCPRIEYLFQIVQRR